MKTRQHGENSMKKTMILGIITLAVLLIVAVGYNNSSEKTDGFTELLGQFNVKVTGDNYKLTNFQLNGLLKDIDDEDICNKYEQYNVDSKEFSPEEILELHYYSLEGSARENFLKRIQNQEVTIEMGDNGAILISYNVDE
jgi:hypothetical protein